MGVTSVEAARRRGCDAILTAVAVDAVGIPVSYGRFSRVVPVGLSKVIVVRDRGCRFPGRDRPPGWCQAHHVVHWARGGCTDEVNLVLLCEHHHHLVHEGGFVVRASPDRVLTVHRRDGTVIQDRGRAP